MKDAGIACVHTGCNGHVIGGINHIPLHGQMDMPYGPISEDNYRPEVRFWCNKCGAYYKHPPGQPDAGSKLLQEERERIANIQEEW